MDWFTNIKSFIQIIDNHSFSKAAEKRYSSPAAMSRRVTWLEEQLGVKLIQRTTRTLHLTEEGKFFYDKGKQLIANLQEITKELQTKQHHPKGPLKITLPYSFSETRLVIHLMRTFVEEHPQVDFTLDFSNQLSDLITEEIDVAFRTQSYRGVGYETLKIASLKIGVYAAPSYIRKHSKPKIPSELINHNCLLHSHIGYTGWEFKNGQKQLVSGNIVSNNTRVLIEYAKQGLGLVRTFENYITLDIKKKLLVPLLQKDWPEEINLYLVYRASPMMSSRIKAFVDFIKSYPISSYLII